MNLRDCGLQSQIWSQFFCEFQVTLNTSLSWVSLLKLKKFFSPVTGRSDCQSYRALASSNEYLHYREYLQSRDGCGAPLCGLRIRTNHALLADDYCGFVWIFFFFFFWWGQQLVSISSLQALVMDHINSTIAAALGSFAEAAEHHFSHDGPVASDPHRLEQ